MLSNKNKILLKIISQKESKNIKELANISGRQRSNLSTTLRTLQRYGLVELKSSNGKELTPVVPYSKLKVNCELFKSNSES